MDKGDTRGRIQVGDRFGELTVIREEDDYVEPSGHRRQKVMVQCSCGKAYGIRAAYLRRGTSRCRKCAYAAQTVCKVGDTFDQLTVTSFEYEGPHRMALCDCSCGGKARRRARLLRHIRTNNCGCAPRGAWTGVGLLSTTSFNRIKRGAQIRNIPFLLDATYLWDLFLKQSKKCALTGIPIVITHSTRKKDTASLDRIDSTKGYTPENVQWVHKDINKMKHNLTQQRFLELCQKVAGHINRQSVP